MLKSRTHFAGALALAAALALSSCAGGSPAQDPTNSSADAASATFNDADVMFAQMMIPHHELAVEMSEDLLAKDGIDAGIVDLATEIKAAQEPEIAQLKDWLTEWGAEDDSMSGMTGMGNDSEGMMTEDDMMALQDATGTDAGRLFLQQMTVHHEGAVAMAQITGENADARALAANILATQTAEIAVMAELLATL